MTRWIAKLVLPLLAAIATGCASMGTGSGPRDSSASPVNFTLKSSHAVSGSMNATPPDDAPSSAEFF